eukprot:8824293-Ditylum_brightwellii.AAC.1
MVLDEDNGSQHSCDDTESEVSSNDKEESLPVVSRVAPSQAGEKKNWSLFITVNERKRHMNKFSDKEIFDLFNGYYLGLATKGYIDFYMFGCVHVFTPNHHPVAAEVP